MKYITSVLALVLPVLLFAPAVPVFAATNTQAPTITSITPMQGSINTPITIYGTNFTSKGSPTIEFRSTSGVLKGIARSGNMSYISSNKIIFNADYVDNSSMTSSNLFPGTYEITVVTGLGTSNTVNFTMKGVLSKKPTITSITPTYRSGSTPITIYGTNFTLDGKIEFRSTGGVLKGTVYFINTDYISDQKIVLGADVISPIPNKVGPLSSGTYEITVVTPDGTSNPVSFRVATLPQYSSNNTTTNNTQPTQSNTTITPTQVQRPTTTFSRNMWRGMRGDDVKKLQQYFNSTNEFRLARTGLGSSGDETTYYGFLLESAVQNFQCRNHIVCGGAPDLTGYGVVGPKTRAKLNELYRQEGGSDVNTTTGSIGTTNTRNINALTDATIRKERTIATIKLKIQQILQMVLKLQKQLALQTASQ